MKGSLDITWARKEAKIGGHWSNVKVGPGRDILLEHVVRVAGGDLDNEVIPPAPTIIDKCLMARKLAGMKAAHDLKNLIQLAKEKELYEAREAAEAARATARATTPERKVK